MIEDGDFSSVLLRASKLMASDGLLSGVPVAEIELVAEAEVM